MWILVNGPVKRIVHSHTSLNSIGWINKMLTRGCIICANDEGPLWYEAGDAGLNFYCLDCMDKRRKHERQV